MSAKATAEQTIEIPLDKIDVGNQQIRETPEDDSIGELAESIAAKGLLQAVGVTELPDGRYQLRWGHRRLLAHRRLGKPTIKATVYAGTEKSIKGLALVENLHRSQMTLQDEVETVAYLVSEEEKTVEQVSQILNKGRQWVLDRLMVPELPLYMRDPLMAGDLPMSHVEVISRVPDEGAQSYLVAQAITNRWNKSQLRIIADCYMTPAAPDTSGHPNIPGTNPNPISKPFLYECEICHVKDTLEKFTLVRIHADGHGCRAISDRPDHASDKINGLDSHTSDNGKSEDDSSDREAKPSEVSDGDPHQ